MRSIKGVELTLRTIIVLVLLLVAVLAIIVFVRGGLSFLLNTIGRMAHRTTYATENITTELITGG